VCLLGEVKPGRDLPLVALTAIGATAAAIAAGTSGAAPAEKAHPATATATAYARKDAKGVHRQVTATGTQARGSRGIAVSASTAKGKGTASASATVKHLSLFDGLIRAASVTVHASAGPNAARGGRIGGLRIAGRKKGSPTRTHSYSLDGYGRATVLAKGRHGIVGIRARLSREYKGTPKGTAVTIAFASASASDEVKAPKTKKKPKRKPTTPAGKLRAIATKGGFAFPVAGKHRFSDDWGAPRQDTGFHEGNDVFADAGTPVVAVTDGVLRRVGTARVPGNRLYLYSKRGDYYFYGHLSSFARDARSGLRVKAGQVIGFVGSTGDAEQTPPHVHFEVHPGAGDAVDPYPFLRAWEKKRDVPEAAWLSHYARDPGARPGTLVVVKDYLAD
jgi:murein DD-endopeptidase MepM/ murein hydrolase activator NlpD